MCKAQQCQWHRRVRHSSVVDTTETEWKRAWIFENYWTCFTHCVVMCKCEYLQKIKPFSKKIHEIYEKCVQNPAGLESLGKNLDKTILWNYSFRCKTDTKSNLNIIIAKMENLHYVHSSLPTRMWNIQNVYFIPAWFSFLPWKSAFIIKSSNFSNICHLWW